MLLANVFKLRCTVVTQEVQSQDLGLPLSAGPVCRSTLTCRKVLTVQVRCKAKLCALQYERRIEIFLVWVLCLTVLQEHYLTHDFVRAFSFSRFRKSVLFLTISQEHYLTLHFYGKEELRFFELVLVQRSWDFFNWFSSNLSWIFLIARFF